MLQGRSWDIQEQCNDQLKWKIHKLHQVVLLVWAILTPKCPRLFLYAESIVSGAITHQTVSNMGVGGGVCFYATFDVKRLFCVGRKSPKWHRKRHEVFSPHYFHPEQALTRQLEWVTLVTSTQNFTHTNRTIYYSSEQTFMALVVQFIFEWSLMIIIVQRMHIPTLLV